MSAEQMVEIPPDTNQILAEIAREGMGWEKALGEPIDNSLDAGADRVVITIDKKARRVRIDDNGEGCPEPHKMFVSGYTTKRGRKTLGRYGVGLKHASYYLCQAEGTTRIVTGAAGRYQRASVCWGDVVRSGRWQIPAPTEVGDDEAKMLLRESQGTSILFDQVRCGWLTADQQAAIEAKLAFTFSPALRHGKQIKFVVNGKSRTLSPPDDPAWSESVEFEVGIGGKFARVRAGILAANDRSNRRGMSYAFGHRIIVADTSEGCGDYSIQGFAGFVELDDRWGLGQNKSQVTDNEWPELCQAVLDGVRPLLEKLKHSTQVIQSESLRFAVEGAINEVFVQGKPRRPHKRGTRRNQAASAVDREVSRATIVEGIGDALGKKRLGTGGLRMDFEDRPDEPHAARVDPNGSRVYLNLAKHEVADARKRDDAKLLAVIVGSHFFQYCVRNDLYGIKKFEDAMGALLDKQIVVQRSAARAG